MSSDYGDAVERIMADAEQWRDGTSGEVILALRLELHKTIRRELTYTAAKARLTHHKLCPWRSYDGGIDCECKALAEADLKAIESEVGG